MSQTVGSPAKINLECCRRLRYKGMFVGTDPDPNLPYYDTGAYWCAHTQNCLGPDGRIVNLESCLPGRTCYESV